MRYNDLTATRATRVGFKGASGQCKCDKSWFCFDKGKQVVANV